MILPGRLSAKLAVLCMALSAVAVVTVVTTPSAHAADPVAINIVDVAGNLQTNPKAVGALKAKKPQPRSSNTVTKAPAPQFPGKIKAMQDASLSGIEPLAS